jgi:hypothetical protein
MVKDSTFLGDDKVEKFDVVKITDLIVSFSSDENQFPVRIAKADERLTRRPRHQAPDSQGTVSIGGEGAVA